MGELRRVEAFRGNEWKGIQFVDLKVGDKFRLFEPDGSPVVGKGDELEGTTEWTVTKGPRYHNKGRTLEVEAVVAGGD